MPSWWTFQYEMTTIQNPLVSIATSHQTMHKDLWLGQYVGIKKTCVCVCSWTQCLLPSHALALSMIAWINCHKDLKVRYITSLRRRGEWNLVYVNLKISFVLSPPTHSYLFVSTFGNNKQQPLGIPYCYYDKSVRIFIALKNQKLLAFNPKLLFTSCRQIRKVITTWLQELYTHATF